MGNYADVSILVSFEPILLVALSPLEGMRLLVLVLDVSLVGDWVAVCLLGHCHSLSLYVDGLMNRD